jgi:hypothetical protein
MLGLGSFYADDPDSSQAGLGLHTVPFVGEALDRGLLLPWLMSPAEQTALIFMLSHLRPKVSIEIGTRFGGSLQAIAKYSQHVYSVDIDPDVPKRMKGRYSNVTYLTGDSDQVLPPLIARLNRESAEVGFVLVDGDHSVEGVRKDIDHVLTLVPSAPLYVVMHDSFNPDCRAGLKLANWLACPFVHAVELDFIPGVVHPSPDSRGQLWGGLALGVLSPEKRAGKFEITGRAEQAFLACLAFTPQQDRALPVRAVRRFARQTLTATSRSGRS